MRSQGPPRLNVAAEHVPPTEKMPGHWLLAKMGKRVLRPGGLRLTERMLAVLDIRGDDAVVEFAPGLGATARLTLARQPASYTAIERDGAAAAAVSRWLSSPAARCVVGTAEATGLSDSSATVVYGEAMLSMQGAEAKSRIVSEAVRLLAPGGRYGIHELCLVPDDLDSRIVDSIARDLSSDIHVGVRPLTVQQWRELLTNAGLTVVSEERSAMHLLEPARIIRDEGVCGAIRFTWNLAWHKEARRRVRSMRRVFRKYRDCLSAVALVATKPQEIGNDRALCPHP